MSPTQRSLKRARDAGGLAAVVERFNPHARVRVDLFGFIDILVLDEGAGVVGVQTTTAQNLSARVRKVTDDQSLSRIARTWLGKGNRIEFHGWRKAGARWVCRVIDLTLVLGEEKLPLQTTEREPSETDQKILSRCKIKRVCRRLGSASSRSRALPRVTRPSG